MLLTILSVKRLPKIAENNEVLDNCDEGIISNSCDKVRKSSNALKKSSRVVGYQILNAKKVFI